MERLYQPDFTCIFGRDYSDAFSYNKIDSLIWPIFSDIKFSDPLNKLLKLEDKEGNPLFYTRELSIEDLKIEMNCSDVSLGLIQAMDTGKSYGIANSDVIEVVKTQPKLFRGILSFDLSQKIPTQNLINEIQNIQELIPVCGIVIYPSLTNLDLVDNDNPLLEHLMHFCYKNSLFVKIDFGNFKFLENHPHYIPLEVIESFTLSNLNNIIILSGFSVIGEFRSMIDRFKNYPNIWLEFDPRFIGGITPSLMFTQIFETPGFIQNFWNRMSIGSAAPTLELSQMVRGFLKATDKLNYTQKNLLKTWAFRNINRLNITLFESSTKLNIKTFVEVKESTDKSFKNHIISTNIIKMRSYSITQLLFLTDVIEKTFNKIMKRYPKINDGELLLRSYHTTTTLLINEHEVGNYLDLHYYFAELSMVESSNFMHTVSAKENRPDFNHPDHRIASTNGSKQLVIPIRNRELELGSRENVYLLATFGPRTLDLLIQLKLYQEN